MPFNCKLSICCTALRLPETFPQRVTYWTEQTSEISSELFEWKVLAVSHEWILPNEITSNNENSYFISIIQSTRPRWNNSFMWSLYIWYNGDRMVTYILQAQKYAVKLQWIQNIYYERKPVWYQGLYYGFPSLVKYRFSFIKLFSPVTHYVIVINTTTADVIYWQDIYAIYHHFHWRL